MDSCNNDVSFKLGVERESHTEGYVCLSRVKEGSRGGWDLLLERMRGQRLPSSRYLCFPYDPHAARMSLNVAAPSHARAPAPALGPQSPLVTSTCRLGSNQRARSGLSDYPRHGMGMAQDGSCNGTSASMRFGVCTAVLNSADRPVRGMLSAYGPSPVVYPSFRSCSVYPLE